MSRDFGKTGNIPKQPEVSVKKVFFSHWFSAQEAAPSYILLEIFRFLVSCCITLQLGSPSNIPSSISTERGGNPTHEEQEGKAPSGCSRLRARTCSHGTCLGVMLETHSLVLQIRYSKGLLLSTTLTQSFY